MVLRSAQEYIEGIGKIDSKIYLGGERVNDVLDHPTTRTVIQANAKVYELSQEPQYREIMTAKSHLTGELISRNLHICQNTKDLEMRAEMALLTSQKLGTCNYRCPGCDVLNGLASITYEIDKDLGTEYYKRLMDFTRYLQKNDLAMSGGVTDTKGDRGKRPLQQDPDMFLHIVEKKPDGIVVRGAKQHQSGAYASDETLVMPTLACHEGEEDYAVAFAVANGTEGVTFICQYNPYTVERNTEADIHQLGNPIYGQRETSLVVFDDVFIPWERVFMCGEVQYTQAAIMRFAKMHRMNCGGACKVGFADLIIGATRMMAEFTGLTKVPHIITKLTRMVQISETSHGCAIAAAHKGTEEPEGSGIFLPNELFGNVAKLNTCYGFWEIMALAGDIAGGLPVTMPSERDLDNPEIGPYVEKYLKSAVSARKRMRLAKFIQNWVAGLHGVGTWQGAGSAEAQMLTLYRIFDFESRRAMVKELAGL